MQPLLFCGYVVQCPLLEVGGIRIQEAVSGPCPAFDGGGAFGSTTLDGFLLSLASASPG
jgi:hypothetical protein